MYVRQSSSKNEESISLELQEEACRAYAEAHDYNVIDVHPDKGISGRRWNNRPGVQRTLADIEAGLADVVLVWKWSRLSRATLDFAMAVHRVEEAGGRVESATEPADTGTASGRLTRDVLASFAVFENERIAEGWRAAQHRRTSQGLPANGKNRFGYLYDRDSKTFTPDPVLGAVLASLYTRYTAGESINALVRFLNDAKIPTAAGYGGGDAADNPWSPRTLRRVLNSGFGAGLVTANGEQFQGAQQPVIGNRTWDRYLAAYARRRTARSPKKTTYLLSGLIRCQCGSAMTAGLFTKKGETKYRCKRAAERRTHSGGYVTARLADEAVHAWLVERNAALLTEGARPRAIPGELDSDRLEQELSDARDYADDLTERWIAGSVDRDVYDRLRARAARDRADLEQRHREAIRAERATPVILLPTLVERWNDYSIEQRRDALRHIITYVEIAPGRPRSKITVHGR